MNNPEIVMKALKEFILRAAEKGATAEEIAALPTVAKVFLDYFYFVESRDSSVL